jgi:hypothetical protein
MKILRTISLVFLLTLSVQSNCAQRGIEGFFARHPYFVIASATATGVGLGVSGVLALLAQKKARKFTYSSPMPIFAPRQKPRPVTYH